MHHLNEIPAGLFKNKKHIQLPLLDDEINTNITEDIPKHDSNRDSVNASITETRSFDQIKSNILRRDLGLSKKLSELLA